MEHDKPPVGETGLSYPEQEVESDQPGFPLLPPRQGCLALD